MRVCALNECVHGCIVCTCVLYECVPCVCALCSVGVHVRYVVHSLFVHSGCTRACDSLCYSSLAFIGHMAVVPLQEC